MNDNLSKMRNGLSLVAVAGVAAAVAGAATGSIALLAIAASITAIASIVTLAIRPKPEPREVQQEIEFPAPPIGARLRELFSSH
jgi:hypothetical protein